MKKLFALSLLFLLILPLQNAEACDIHLSIVGDQKESYKAGDEIVVKVEVVFTHRVCTEGIENTKFKYDGVKVLGATKWQETGNGKYERKLKLQVLEGQGDKLLLQAIRTCDKEGGSGTITLVRG